jgi:hypothetical protein
VEGLYTPNLPFGLPDAVGAVIRDVVIGQGEHVETGINRGFHVITMNVEPGVSRHGPVGVDDELQIDEAQVVGMEYRLDGIVDPARNRTCGNSEGWAIRSPAKLRLKGMADFREVRSAAGSAAPV